MEKRGMKRTERREKIEEGYALAVNTSIAIYIK